VKQAAALDVEGAEAYAARHALHALLIARGGRVVHERYGGGYDATKAHALYSGTKSFWGVAAVAAEEDGLLALDEPVGATFPAWRDGPRGRVTLRMLLQLTSGIGFGGLGTTVPPYEKALATMLKDPPGTKFTYGGIPLQVFGAVLARKLEPRGLTPHAYLRERILDRIGVRIAPWRKLPDGTSPLPTGATVTARAWLQYGRFVLDRGRKDGETIVAQDALARCFAGSAANPRYGLCWWLSPLANHPDIVYASGSGGQALYVIPAADAVVVHFGDSSSFKHEAFLKRLLATMSP
jgi:CubicO group peptidase (beta-lactamase class C family)